MNQITPHPLWIGSSGALRDWRRLYELGIRAVVQLADEEPPPALPHDFIACRFPLVDGGDNDVALLRSAIHLVTHLLEEKFATLVCCQAGLSRSPAIAAAALARLTKLPFARCLSQIGADHAIGVQPALFAQVQALSLEP